MTTQKQNNRTHGLRDRRLRIIINDAPSTGRRVESTWKEEAIAVLAPPEERVAASIVSDIEMVSALRQPRTWDVRSEPRAVALIPREETEAQAAPAPRIKTRPVSGSRQWEWWQIIAPTVITVFAVWQLLSAMP